ncbi:MAG: hypothetical protein KCHDKBKB_01336 [Elusimicrobia bacterium]|nr:hypothetical protein [Elusimicrobiota bacterium]
MLKYWISFGLQSLGTLIVLWRGVPFYRSFLSGELDPGSKNLLWSILVILLIQPAYWWARKRAPNPGAKSQGKTVLGHTILFLSRLIFVFIGSLFTAVFYMDMADIHLSGRIILLIAILFSTFCYTLELERLGKLLIDGSN